MTVLAVVGILLVATIGSRYTLLRVRWLRLYLVGAEFVLLGLFLGGEAFGRPFLDILGGATRQALQPLAALALGWAGFLFGHHLRGDVLRRFPRSHAALAVCEATVTAATVFGVLGVAAPALGVVVRPGLALALAGAAAVSAPTALALLRREWAPSGASPAGLEALQFAAGTDEVVALPVFATGLLWLAHGSGAALGTALASTVALGLALGAFIHLSTMIRVREEELRLIVLGAITFGAGAALRLGLSPLLATAVAGALGANLGGWVARTGGILVGLEKPIYAGLLVFAGSGLLVDGPVLALAAVLAAARIAGKVAGVAAGSAVTRGHVAPTLGLGLASHGGVALAMLVSLGLASSGLAPPGLDDPVRRAVSAAVIAMATSELVAPQLAGLVLRAPETEPC